MKIGKLIYKYAMILSKSYGYAKWVEKSGMAYSDVLLWKDCMKDTSNYYGKKLSIFLLSHLKKRAS